MPQNPPADFPRVTPYLGYEDVAAALDWLQRAFGFEERLRFAEPDGRISHAEMRLADGVIMLGGPRPAYRNPRRTGTSDQHWVHVYVDDVDAHFARARAAGATILAPPEDKPYGDRGYRAEDPEGHRWMFSQRVRDVAPTDWGAVEA